MSQPTAQDQYMLELVNRGRANPQGEADLYLNGDLNQGLPSNTISTDAKQPLVLNLQLHTAAQDHNQWMLDNNVFSHTGEGGSSPSQRMQAAGYVLTPPWSTGENIAYRGTSGTPDLTTFVRYNHENLFVSPGHRKNLMNGNFEEVGISSLQGQFKNYNAVMTTQKFAFSGDRGPFITGVAYTDAEDNDFYTVGEGIKGITVTAVDITNSANAFTTTTFDAGGYSLDVDPNVTYDVTFSGDLDQDGQADDIATYQVKVNSENVKLDVVSDDLPTSNTNQAPTDLDLDNKIINENVAPNSVVGTFSTTDPDNGDTFTYELVAGNGDTDNQAFSINDEQLKINSSPDYETKSSYSIRVKTTDEEGSSYEEQLTINVKDVNENSSPTDLDLDNKIINENVAPNSVVGTFSTTDPDNGDTFTYELVAGNGDTDNLAFTINDLNQLQINESPDYETKSSYSIRVKTTDEEGSSYEEQLTINVKDVNENSSPTDENSSPTDLDLDNKIINENVAPNSVVGTFSTTDPDNGDTFTYELVAGNGDTDNLAFTINDLNQLQINESPDYETKSSYSIRVKTTDEEGSSYEEQLTINVKDVNENSSPTDLDLDNKIINENVAPNSVVGTFSTTDPDNGDTFTYELVAGNGDTDNLAFTINNLNQLQINESPDYETKSSYSIRVKTTDEEGSSYEEQLTINVKNIIESTDQAIFTKDLNGNYLIIDGDKELQLKDKRGRSRSDKTNNNWNAIAVEPNEQEGYDVLLQGQNKFDGKAYVWTTNSQGVITSGSGWKKQETMLSWETKFDVDLNGDEIIGNSFTIIEEKGAATFAENADRTYWIIDREKELQLKNQRGRGYSDKTNNNWNAIAVEPNEQEGYDVLLQGQNKFDGKAYVWTT
ncbi:MAG: cadherin domain-containing protein, partial [Trichodesmium sp. MAG_R02]|nr:cadherin domain-containing protein [Trichodesmium sp. MAG_R02]